MTCLCRSAHLTQLLGKYFLQLDPNPHGVEGWKNDMCADLTVFGFNCILCSFHLDFTC